MTVTDLKRYVGMQIADVTEHADGTIIVALRLIGVPEHRGWRYVTIPNGPITERVPGYRRDLLQAEAEVDL